MELSDAEEIDEVWLEVLDHSEPRIRELARAAAEHPVLRKLRPVVHPSGLGFSRRPRYPFDLDLPHVGWSPRCGFEVYSQAGEILLSGSVGKTMAYVARAIAKAG